MLTNNRFLFLGGKRGIWRVTSIKGIRGPSLESVERIDVVQGAVPAPLPGTAWVLQGLTSNVRYATGREVDHLRARQPALGRPEATRAALIPIRKTSQWWDLAQDERRAIFEEQSHHNLIGLDYLPAVARRLHHCRDIGEPFDFLTWFEFAPEHAAAFEGLVSRLRATREWDFVDCEVDIRLERAD
jgi:hypothetical protein